MSRRATDKPRPCGKRRLSESKAQGVVKKSRRSPNPNRQEQRVYFCPGCQCWHTASTPYLSFAERAALVSRDAQIPFTTSPTGNYPKAA